MLLFFSILILIAIFSTLISVRFGVPVLILFILIGIIVGSDVLNLFYFDNARLTKQIADILIIFIIFDGGFRISRKSFYSVAGPSLTLATLGVFITALILGICIHFILKMDFLYSIMIASIISSTDAAAVFMITKQNPIKANLATTLNVESAANDPMAILLTVTCIQFLTSGFSSVAIIGVQLLWQFSGGIIIGLLMAKFAIIIYDKFNSDNRGNYNVLIIGLILFTFGFADLLKANGIIAVFFFGYRMGNNNFTAKRGVSNFIESIAVMCNVSLFLLLGFLAFPSRFIHVWKEGLVVVLIMMFFARPIAVLISTAFFKYTIKEKIFLSWGGIKGAVPIVLATYPSAYNLDKNGLIFDIIFFAVFLSCILQGTTLAFLAKIFHFTLPQKPSSPYVVELHTTVKSSIDMFEINIEANACCIGKQIVELKLDNDVLISSIIRDGQIIMPKGNVKIQENDILYILAHEKKIAKILTQLNESCESTLNKEKTS